MRKLTGVFYGEEFTITEDPPEEEYSITCDNPLLYQLTDKTYNPNTGAIEQMSIMEGIEEAFFVLNSLQENMSIEIDKVPEDILKKPDPETTEEEGVVE